MSNDLVTDTTTGYGAIQPSGTVGADEFARHDAAASWQDGGEAEALAGEWTGSLAEIIARYGAEQVKLGVLEWFQGSYGQLWTVNGEVVFLLDASSQTVKFGTFYRLAAMFKQTITEAENAGDQDMLRAIQRFMADVGGSFRQPTAAVPSAVGGGHLREGRIRPPVPGTRAGSGARNAGTGLPAERTGTGKRAATPRALPRQG